MFICTLPMYVLIGSVSSQNRFQVLNFRPRYLPIYLNFLAGHEIFYPLAK
jgi:hypothetical protein